MFASFDTGFSFLRILGILIFAFVIGMFVFIIVKLIRDKRKNDASPRLTVDAFVVSKHTSTSSSSQPVAGDPTGAHGFHHMTTTDYFVTFEVQSGDRMGFEVDEAEYAMLAEGDTGRLSFQGTRYLGFEREA